METFLQILPYLVTILVAVLTGIITYLIAIKQSKLDFKKETELIQLDERKFVKELHNSEKYKIYHELCEKTLLMVQDSLFLFPPFLDQIPQDKEEQKVVFKERYKRACSSYDELTKCLFSNAAFIDEDIHQKFDEIRESCRLQIVFYPDFVLVNDPRFEEDYAKPKEECWKRGKKIDELQSALISFLRKKIDSFESPQASK